MLLYRSFRFAPIRGLLQFNQGTKCEQLVLLVTGVQELLPEEKPETNEQDINRKLTVVVKNWQLNHIYIYIISLLSQHLQQKLLIHAKYLVQGPPFERDNVRRCVLKCNSIKWRSSKF